MESFSSVPTSDLSDILITDASTPPLDSRVNEATSIIALLTILLAESNLSFLQTRLTIHHNTISLLKIILNKTPSFFDDLESDIKKIMADNVLDMSDVPTLVIMMKDICNLKMSDLTNEVKKITVDESIQLIHDLLLILIDFNYITVTDKRQVVKIIDTSILLLRSTIDTQATTAYTLKACFPCLFK
jgi:hypothetical protein